MRNRRWALDAAVATLTAVLAMSGALADRIVLAPKAKTLPAGAWVAEWAAASVSGDRQIGWLALGVPKEDLGVELEYEEMRTPFKTVGAFSAQYSLIGEAFTNFMAPAISVGIRDIGNTGRQGRAYYVALSRTIGFSEIQEQLLGSLRVHAGVGSNRLGGAYLGADISLPIGLNVAAEVVNRRLDVRARWHLVGPVSVEALSLDGQGYAGLAISVGR